MKVIYAILLISNVFYLRAQEEVTSFYFSEPQPAASSHETKFDSTFCGKFLYQEDTLISLVITPDSIYTHFGTFTFITNKELKKSNKFKIENELLYGIKEGQGIPYIEQNDTVFTYITQDDLVFKPTKENKLYKNGDHYFLNMKEDNGYYTTQVLTLNNGKLFLHTIDHEKVLDELLSFGSTKTKQVDGFKTYLSAPTKKEFISFVENEGFKDATIYLRPENL